MKRFAVTSAVLLGFLALAPGAFAQAAKATATHTDCRSGRRPPPAVAKARMATPVKGTAYVEVIQGQAKKVGDDMVTVSKVKNVSNAPIAGLRIDEYLVQPEAGRRSPATRSACARRSRRARSSRSRRSPR